MKPKRFKRRNVSDTRLKTRAEVPLRFGPDTPQGKAAQRVEKLREMVREADARGKSIPVLLPAPKDQLRQARRAFKSGVSEKTVYEKTGVVRDYAEDFGVVPFRLRLSDAGNARFGPYTVASVIKHPRMTFDKIMGKGDYTMSDLLHEDAINVLAKYGIDPFNISLTLARSTEKLPPIGSTLIKRTSDPTKNAYAIHVRDRSPEMQFGVLAHEFGGHVVSENAAKLPRAFSSYDIQDALTDRLAMLRSHLTTLPDSLKDYSPLVRGLTVQIRDLDRALDKVILQGNGATSYNALAAELRAEALMRAARSGNSVSDVAKEFYDKSFRSVSGAVVDPKDVIAPPPRMPAASDKNTSRMFNQDAKGGDTQQAAKAGDTEGPEVSEVPVEEPVPQATEPIPEGGPRIVINPEVFEDKRDALCVAFNEAFRVLMEMTEFEPMAEPTDAQRQFFADTAYAEDELQLRRTILARIATLDTSVKDPTDDQLEETIEFLETVMEIGAPQSQWEQQAVQRLHDLLGEMLEAAQEERDAGEPTGVYATDETNLAPTDQNLV